MNIKDQLDKLQEQIKVLEHQGQHLELVPKLEEKLKLIGEIYGEDSVEYAAALNDYASIHRSIGNHEQSEKAFIKAAEILKVQLGEQHPDYGTTINNIAGLYRLMHRWADSEKAFLRCLDIYRRSLGNDHFLTISALKSY